MTSSGDELKAGDAVRGSLEIDGQVLSLRVGETVLEALERAGLEPASGCRSGSCCKCLLQGDNPPPESQKTLRPTLRQQGYFLACQARPTGQLVLQGTVRETAAVATRVVRTEVLAPQVIRLILEPRSELDYFPGQYVDVLGPDGAGRSYSLASLPSDGVLELHVRLIPGGRVSPWIHQLQVGDEVSVRGPYGQCFYLEGEPQRSLLLVGAGTGLAPLLGIARDALTHGHSGRIDLIQGGLRPDRLYLREELANLAAEHAALHVHACVLEGGSGSEHVGALNQVALDIAGLLKQTRSYLCGDPALVANLRRSLFLAGAPSQEILADAFTPARPDPNLPSQATTGDVVG